MMKNIQELLVNLNIKYRDLQTYEIAFTHSSYNADVNTKHHDYERLEFLGDSVIGFVISEVAFELHPDMGQGLLTKLKSSLVSTNFLAQQSLNLHFDEYVKVGNSFMGDIRKSSHLLEDIFEAFCGALYLDQGFAVAKEFIVTIFKERLEKVRIDDLTDYKSKLQEEMQAEHRESVIYEVIGETGPAHDRHFTVHVLFDGIEMGIGEGSSKKQAEQNAAKEALKKRVK